MVSVLLVVYLMCRTGPHMLYLHVYFSVRTILEICFFYLTSLFMWFNILQIAHLGVFSARVDESLEKSKKHLPWIIWNLLFTSEIGSWMHYFTDIFGNNWLLNSAVRFNICKFSDSYYKFYYKQDLRRILSVYSYLLLSPGFD